MSEKLLAVITEEAGDANERASNNEKESVQLRKDAETEHLARVKIEAAVGWRSLTKKQKQDMGAALVSFNSKAGANMWFDGSSTEAEMFADDIAEALRYGHITTSSPGSVLVMHKGGNWNDPIRSVETGVVVQSTKAPAAIEFAAALIKQLKDRGFDAKRQTDPPFDEQTADPVIWVTVQGRPNGPQGEYKLQAEREARPKNSSRTKTR